MGLTKSKGNMYPWVSHTWNPIKGCKYGCPYCYVEIMVERYGYDNGVRFDEKDLGTNLGMGRTIFVGSVSDMWGSWAPQEWIEQVLSQCAFYGNNEYVFQSKNPQRFEEKWVRFPNISKTLIGTTIETDCYPAGFKTNAPPIDIRISSMIRLKGMRRFVTIEPIMNFDYWNLVEMIAIINPEFVTIGADSKGHNLIEPSWEKVQNFIDRLSNSLKIEIRQKTNLDRLKK